MPKLDYLALTKEQVAEYTALCRNGAPAPCSAPCPFGLEVRTFIDKCENGKWKPAYKLMRSAFVFPQLVSKLCPGYCKNACVRGGKNTARLGGSIELGALERAVCTFVPDKKSESFALPPKQEKIAVIGAGAAGLSAALCLVNKKFGVTVFEQNDGWGGGLRENADFAVFDGEFTESFSKTDVEFRFSERITDTAQLAGYNAVIIATESPDAAFGKTPVSEDSLWCGGKHFTVGGARGADTMHGIADGRRAALAVETWLQTGTPSPHVLSPNAGHTPDTDGAACPQVTPAGVGGYTQEEAVREASRCLQCDCSNCMKSCELLRTYKKLPQPIATEVFSDTRVTPPFSAHTITRETYSCNECGFCAGICPECINMGEVFDISRRARFSKGENLAAIHDFWLREMDFHVGEGLYSTADSGENCEYVFFPGCQLGAYLPETVKKTYELLSKKYSVGLLGACCGAPAHWAGDDDRRDLVIAELRRQIARFNAGERQAPKLVFACSTCGKMLKKHLPELETVSVYELLTACGLESADISEEWAVFDPCAAREDENTQAAVRKLLGAAGVSAQELPEKGRCCGYGGLIRLANPELYGEVTKNRVGLSDAPFAVYCANCRSVFADEGKPARHVLELVLGTHEEIKPKIDDRRKNVLALCAEFDGEGRQVPKEEALRLIIDNDLYERLDRDLISLEDMRFVIENSPEKGGVFETADGSRLCYCEIGVLVYWVRYAERGGAVEILDAYYHRMKFGQEDAK
ncbi:MAG: NAD(P)-binding protein [Oscillospiraceae bacterium]|jgi:Fe-S oxidoreductase|nr:NAD(P)-binding protein [Oscillospiraceae bacterium]